MKKFIAFFAILMMFPIYSFADRNGEEQVILQKTKSHGGHLETYPSADMPDVYYNDDTDEIIIIGYGFSSYYDVLIIRNSTNQTMVSTQISGYGDTIDVSSLPSDNFTIVITSECNNVFEGQFSIE